MSHEPVELCAASDAILSHTMGPSTSLTWSGHPFVDDGLPCDGLPEVGGLGAVGCGGSALVPSASASTVSEWAASTRSQLSSSKALRQQAKLQLQECWANSARLLADERSSATSSRVGAALQERLKRKQAVEQGISKTVEDRLETTQMTIRRVNSMLGDLQRAIGLRFGNQSVAEKRLELREKRPPQENVRDRLQEALEQERDAMAKARELLSDLVREGRSAVEHLAAAREELLRSRHTLHLDRTNRPREVLDKVKDMEADAVKFCRVSAEAIARTEQEAEQFSGKTTAALKRRIVETVNLRRALEEEIRETRITIGDAETHLERLQFRLKRIEGAPERALDVGGGGEHSGGEGVEERRPQTGRPTTGAPNLNSVVFANIRNKIKAASYTGHAGRRLDALFMKFDRDGSGELDEHEFKRALRRTLRISSAAVSDAEIAILCETLDLDKTGTISVDEIVAFLEADEDVATIREQRDAAKALLDQLKVARKQLDEDLRAKTAAWRVDEACLKVTPIKGLELDALFGASVSTQRTRSEASTASTAQSARLSLALPPTVGAGLGAGVGVAAPTPPASARSARRPPPFTLEASERVRSKIKAAAASAHAGVQLEVLLGRSDKAGAGRLDELELRRALRKFLLIPTSAISDAEIASLCASVDMDASGTVSIAAIAAFINAGAEAAVPPPRPPPIVERGWRDLTLIKRMEPSGCAPVVGVSGCPGVGTPQAQVCGLSSPAAAKPRPSCPPLSPGSLQTLRKKLRAAAYSGDAQEQLDLLFARFDADGSGRLDDGDVKVVLRRALRVPPAVISDREILSLCAELDAEKSGKVIISELAAFVGGSPSVHSPLMETPLGAGCGGPRRQLPTGGRLQPLTAR